MIGRGILRPVLPEIGDPEPLKSLIAREREAGIVPEPLRRLAALLPADPELAGLIAARLRLSNKAAKRLVAVAERVPGDADRPFALAYSAGTEEAADRILLGNGDPACAGAVLEWARPRFPLTGGDLIAMGLAPGPLVARTLQQVERAWVADGFAGDREVLKGLARTYVDQVLRDSQ
jgi:poly(A) polymerase